MKSITLKLRRRIYQGKGNYIARIVGSSTESNFEREYLAHDEISSQNRRTVTVGEPGLFEIRNINVEGNTDTYIAFDGKNEGEVSFQEALSLATRLNKAELKQIALKALLRDRQKRKANRLRKKELCIWLLGAAQKMGQLEHRWFDDSRVQIEVYLPIKVIPRDKPGWVGFKDPTLCGRRSNSHAWEGSADFQKLMSKTLNQLTRSELERFAKPMCRAYDENAMIQRVLAVIDHADCKHFADLQTVVDLTENFNVKDCPFRITAVHYLRFLRLALNEGCLLHPNQITQLL